MISFANPALLWSLLALAVPITIHLLSRKEGSVIPLGSLKHIQETSTQQFRGIRLNEVWLLMLRCAIIIILSLMLSGLSIRSGGNGKWVVVEPGAEQLTLVKNQIDSLRKDGYEAHWLAENFPLLSDSINKESYSYVHLLENLKAKNLEQAVIFSFSKAIRLGGNQLALSDHLKWINVPVEEKKKPVLAVLNGDRVFVRWVTSDASQTKLDTRAETDYQDGKLALPARVRVFIKESEDQHQNQVMKAVFDAIGSSSPFHQITFTNLDSADWVIWLVKETPPDIAANVLWLQPQTSGELLIQKKANLWHLTQRLNEETVLNGNLLTTLSSLVLKDNSIDQTLDEMDQRTFSDTAWASVISKEDGSKAMKSVMDWLFILLILVMLSERLLSYQRHQ